MSHTQLLSSALALCMGALSQTILDCIMAVFRYPWCKYRFSTSSCTASTNRALDFVESHGTVRNWLMQGTSRRPIGTVVCFRGLWLAVVEAADGNRREGETTTFSVELWWPRWWASPPPELVPLELHRPGWSQRADMVSWLKRCTSWCPCYERSFQFIDTSEISAGARRAADEILEVVRLSKRGSAVLHLVGPPSSGKTSGTIHAAKIANATLCLDQYNWATDGDSFDVVVKCAMPTASAPLFVVINEGDLSLIERLELSKRNKNGTTGDRNPAPCRSKASVIALMDNITRNDPEWAHVVLIVTGNTKFPAFERRVAELVTAKGEPLDFSITKAERMHVINVGGGPDYDRGYVSPAGDGDISSPGTASVIDDSGEFSDCDSDCDSDCGGCGEIIDHID